MVKVRATNVSRLRGIRIKELGRLANPGEIFEVSENRVDVLLGKNAFNAKFIDVVESAKLGDIKEVEPKKEKVVEKPKEEPIPVPTDPTIKPMSTEEPVKKTTKKRTKKVEK
jgi:hypothetical protein